MRGILACLSAVLGLLLLPAAAMAVPPGNDDFENGQVLSGTLPIAETGTNLEATKEPEEPSLGYITATHSVWYEWEATVSGFVTVNTCGSLINPIIGVYTGSAVNALTQVAGAFATRGPECPGFDGEAVTFKATSGTTYEILVDGVAAFWGGDQGSFNLEILQTPVPANDDFADAEVLNGDWFSPDVWTAGTEGFTWNATKEPGEPAHAGDPGGASVWYSFDPPFSGVFIAQACGRFEKSVLGVYTGSSVGALTEVAADGRSCSFTLFTAAAGTTYRIAVDGRFDSGSGSPLMGAISVGVLWQRPPFVEPEREKPIAELSEAQTQITKKVVRLRDRSVTFYFGSSAETPGFSCTLDKRESTRCRPPRTYRHLKPGRHVFRVASVGRNQGWDFTPAEIKFRIPKPKPRR
ncbi:MAG: hypothetical protein ACJ76B_04700 [Solirubrobacterales bacterium]